MRGKFFFFFFYTTFYPFTPLEKAGSGTNANEPSDSVLFLVLSMVVIAAALYLPEHVTMMARRAWFYYAGDESGGRDVGGGPVSDGIGTPGRMGSVKSGVGGDEMDMLGRL